MAKQTFTTGQVLTAAQMTSLQQTAMLGGAASAKTASYTLVAADAGTAISMSNAGATTITVNTGLFAAGDTVQITNLGAGVCTITAGTATVNTSASLALAQYESGTLYFTSTSAAIFIKGAGAAAGGGGKVLQVVSATYSTEAQNNTSTYADTGLTATITPTLASSTILVTVHQTGIKKNDSTSVRIRLLRGATSLIVLEQQAAFSGAADQNTVGGTGCTYLDSPATTSATTYKTQFLSVSNLTYARVQEDSSSSTITLMEIGV